MPTGNRKWLDVVGCGLVGWLVRWLVGFVGFVGLVVWLFAWLVVQGIAMYHLSSSPPQMKTWTLFFWKGEIVKMISSPEENMPFSVVQMGPGLSGERVTCAIEEESSRGCGEAKVIKW